jgi:hypothetical protein
MSFRVCRPKADNTAVLRRQGIQDEQTELACAHRVHRSSVSGAPDQANSNGASLDAKQGTDDRALGLGSGVGFAISAKDEPIFDPDKVRA